MQGYTTGPRRRVEDAVPCTIRTKPPARDTAAEAKHSVRAEQVTKTQSGEGNKKATLIDDASKRSHTRTTAALSGYRATIHHAREHNHAPPHRC